MTDWPKPLPEIIPGRCPWKEAGPDGHRACTLPENHDGDCDMQPAPTGGPDA